MRSQQNIIKQAQILEQFFVPAFALFQFIKAPGFFVAEGFNALPLLQDFSSSLTIPLLPDAPNRLSASGLMSERGNCRRSRCETTAFSKKGGRPMELSPADKKRIQQQFDCFAKKVLRGEANSYIKEVAARAKREISFSELSEAELDKLLTVDEYSTDSTHYNINGFDIAVRNDLLVEALNALPDRKREIILLSYFLDMSDAEIAALLQNNRKTIYRHRTTGLDLLKNLMKEEPPNDENQEQ